MSCFVNKSSRETHYTHMDREREREKRGGVRERQRRDITEWDREERENASVCA